MTDRQFPPGNRSNRSDDSLWEALEQSRREAERTQRATDQRLKMICQTLAVLTERLVPQQAAVSQMATPLPPPPPYPLPQAADPQSRLEGAMAQQTRFQEAARNMPARVLDF